MSSTVSDVCPSPVYGVEPCAAPPHQKNLAIPANIPIYAYITGLVKVPGQVFYRYDPVSRKPVEMSTGDNTITDASKIQTGLSGATYSQNYPNAWANYSIPLDRSGVTEVADLSSFDSTNIPGFGNGDAAFSGRIWISVGKPLLPFTPRVGGDLSGAGKVDGYTTPVVAANGVGALCFYDWLEFSYSVDGLLYINTTQVDQYGFPVSASATGESVVGSTYLDTVISDALLHWKGDWLSVTCSSNALQKTYYGRTQADNKTLIFYKDTLQTGGPQFSFDDLTTQNVLDCDGQMTGVGVPQVGDLLVDLRNTGKAILAGFNRGVIGTTTTELNIDAGGSYTPPLSDNYKPGVPFNAWAQHFHDYSASGLAYGFAYDDVGDQQPMIIATKTTSLKLALGKFE